MFSDIVIITDAGAAAAAAASIVTVVVIATTIIIFINIIIPGTFITVSVPPTPLCVRVCQCRCVSLCDGIAVVMCGTCDGGIIWVGVAPVMADDGVCEWEIQQ